MGNKTGSEPRAKSGRDCCQDQQDSLNPYVSPAPGEWNTGPPPTSIRMAGARWTGTVAIALLLFSIVLFAWMWIHAYRTGAIPETEWGTYRGNHGPWRHRYDLRSAWHWVSFSHLLAFVLGIVSLVIKPSLRALYIILAAFAIGFLFMSTHYWLVD